MIEIKKIKYYLFARSSSFSAKKIKSFKIIRKIKDLTYKLKLLWHIKIHNVIFVKHLEQINYNAL
jgi:transposase